MTWFGTVLEKGSFQPKQKNRFMVQMGVGGNLVSVKSVGKPIATVESKQYRMINHYYNYPGIVKWEPITITFVDIKRFGADANIEDSFKDKGFPSPTERMTSHALWEMLLSSGYTPPSGQTSKSSRAPSISSPEKASTIHHSFGNMLKIHQLHPDGTEFKEEKNQGTLKSVETWELHNPIITKITWGELDYGDDSLVEYSLEVTYDWAVHYPENKLNVDDDD